MVAQSNISHGTLTMAFVALVNHLEGSGVLADGEFAATLERAAETFPPERTAELRELATCLKGRPEPTLTAIDGGKHDEPPPAA